MVSRKKTTKTRLTLFHGTIWRLMEIWETIRKINFTFNLPDLTQSTGANLTWRNVSEAS